MTDVTQLDIPALQTPITGNLFRHRWTWSGNGIGLGFSSFYNAGGTAQPLADAAGVLMNGILGATGSNLPSGVTVVPDPLCDLIDPTNGQLVNSQPVTPPATVTGGASVSYPAMAGMCVTWQTVGVVGGRRVRGRTFFVPITTSKYQPDGTIDNTYLASCRVVAAAFATSAATPVVWHRPTAVGSTDGVAFYMTGAKITDKAAMLTSRR